MAAKFTYRCTKCNTKPGNTPMESRSLLTVKKVTFCEMGMNGRVIRSRSREWLCPDCLEKDTDYNQPEQAIREQVS